jgi:hypothetical protein
MKETIEGGEEELLELLDELEGAELEELLELLDGLEGVEVEELLELLDELEGVAEYEVPLELLEDEDEDPKCAKSFCISSWI